MDMLPLSNHESPLNTQFTVYDDGRSAVRPQIACKRLSLPATAVHILQAAGWWVFVCRCLSSPCLSTLLCTRPGGHTVWLPVWLWQNIRDAANTEFGLQRLIHVLLHNDSARASIHIFLGLYVTQLSECGLDKDLFFFPLLTSVSHVIYVCLCVYEHLILIGVKKINTL